MEIDDLATCDDRPELAYLFKSMCSILATVLGLFTLFTTSLRATLAITHLARLKLFPLDNDRAYVASAVARVALEMGSSDKVTFGVNPRQEIKASRAALFQVLFILKRAGCVFMLRWIIKKIVVKKFGTRTAAKYLLDFAAIPVNMFWNCLTMRRVMDDALTVSVGPASAQRMLKAVMSDPNTKRTSKKELPDDRLSCDLSALARVELIRAIGAVIVTGLLWVPAAASAATAPALPASRAPASAPAGSVRSA